MSAPRVSVYDDATERWRLIEGDALELLARLPDACVHGIICDPPYGLGLIDKAWDGAAIWKSSSELSREENFQRWTTTWARECRRVLLPGGHLLAFGAPRTFHRLVAGVEDAGLEVRDQLLWLFESGIPKSRHLPGGRGSNLKPCFEPILLARAPLQGTLSANLARFGTGALNIDAARIHRSEGKGYWPSHVVTSHHPECPVGLVDGEQLGASRLFLCPKASSAEREAGCDDLPLGSPGLYSGARRSPRLTRNPHPTVKPLELMRWLIRLAVPEGGTVLDPFSGSGTTGIAAVLESRPFVGIEREGQYIDVACARLVHWSKGGSR